MLQRVDMCRKWKLLQSMAFTCMPAAHLQSISINRHIWNHREAPDYANALPCRELLENGGFIYMPAGKVRARGKAAATISASAKAGVMGAAIGKSPAHFSRYCPLALMTLDGMKDGI